MRKNWQDLHVILSAGAGVRISATHYELEDLIKLARAAKQGKAMLTITDADSLDVQECMRIISSGQAKGLVQFE